MATKDEIRVWFQRGLFSSVAPYTHMIIWHDTFSGDSYPAYAVSRDHALALIGDPGGMEMVMEVYDLSMDMEAQLDEYRAKNL